MLQRDLLDGALEYPVEDVNRPAERGDCIDEDRPCPFVACKYHLYLDVNEETGSIKINFPDLEVWEMGETCALDAADRGGLTLEEVGDIVNLTRERIRQVEVRGLLTLKMAMPAPGEFDFSAPAAAKAKMTTPTDRILGVLVGEKTTAEIADALGYQPRYISRRLRDMEKAGAVTSRVESRCDLILFIWRKV